MCFVVFINNGTKGQASFSLGQDSSAVTRTLGLVLAEIWWVKGSRSKWALQNLVASQGSDRRGAE